MIGSQCCGVPFAGDSAEQVVTSDMYTGTFNAVSSDKDQPLANSVSMLIPQQSSSTATQQEPEGRFCYAPEDIAPEDVVIPEEFQLRESQTYEGKKI